MDPTDLIGLGDHLALEFLNSTATPGRERVELIGDGPSYLTWLARAGLIDAADRDGAARAFSPAELDAAAAQAIELREWLRPVIAVWAAAPGPARPDPAAPGSVPPSAVRDRLNQILATDCRFPQLDDGPDGQSRVRQRRRWQDPGQLLAPPAEAVALLLSTGDPQLVRPCEGSACTLWFYDRTRSHRRRWCSMAACGNRAKAARHRGKE
jgi:predicted RNA-binding Zn ribbon-like protein